MNISQTFINLRRKYSQSNREAMRNPWFLGWLVLLATFLSVNAVFVILAITSNPGLVVQDYYQQGRQYEQHVLERIAAEKNLRWTTRLEIPKTIVRDLEDVYRFSIEDVRGLPVNNALVKLVAYRPSDAEADFVTTLQESTPGLYEGDLRFSLPGVWDLKVEVQSDADQYEMSHRIFVLNPAAAER
jgi:nitrogen fixation protein FixH